MLSELRRALDASPARKLGYVVTGADPGDGYYRSSGRNAGRIIRARRALADSVPAVGAKARDLLDAISGTGRAE
jgi:hypothetical protein